MDILVIQKKRLFIHWDTIRTLEKIKKELGHDEKVTLEGAIFHLLLSRLDDPTLCFYAGFSVRSVSYTHLQIPQSLDEMPAHKPGKLIGELCQCGCIKTDRRIAHSNRRDAAFQKDVGIVLSLIHI